MYFKKFRTKNSETLIQSYLMCIIVTHVNMYTTNVEQLLTSSLLHQTFFVEIQ